MRQALRLFAALATALSPLAVRAQEAERPGWLAPPSEASETPTDDTSTQPQAPTQLQTGAVPPAPPPGYAYPAPAYAQPAPVYAQPAPTYAPPAPVYAPPAYAQQPAYAAPVAPAAPVQLLPVQTQPTPLYVTQCPDPLPVESPSEGKTVIPPGYSLAAGVLIKTPLQGAARLRYEQLSEQLKDVQAEQDFVAAQKRTRIGVPITAMVLGYGTAVAGAVVAHNSFTAARDIGHGDTAHRHDINDDGKTDGRDQHRYRNIAYGFTAASAVGALTGLLGTTSLGRRLAQRQIAAAYKKDVDTRVDTLKKQLDYSLSAGPQQLQLGLSGRF